MAGTPASSDHGQPGTTRSLVKYIQETAQLILFMQCRNCVAALFQPGIAAGSNAGADDSFRLTPSAISQTCSWCSDGGNFDVIMFDLMNWISSLLMMWLLFGKFANLVVFLQSSRCVTDIITEFIQDVQDTRRLLQRLQPLAGCQIPYPAQA